LEIQDRGLELLSAHGLERYEVSAFSTPPRQARHNLNYWSFGDYIGIGAGAHGKVTLTERGRIIRTRKRRQPGHYLQALSANSSFSAETLTVATAELALEFMLNALRLADGFTPVLFEARTGLPFSVVEKQIESLQDRKLLATFDGRVRATAHGMQFLNTVLEEFI
jgi:oxygen-independent coproporphyrinogen-3 oxidase